MNAQTAYFIVLENETYFNFFIQPGNHLELTFLLISHITLSRRITTQPLRH